MAEHTIGDLLNVRRTIQQILLRTPDSTIRSLLRVAVIAVEEATLCCNRMVTERQENSHAE